MRKKEELVKSKGGTVIAFALHCMLGIIVWLILSFLFSIMISTEVIPASGISYAACASVFLGSLTASILSAVKFGKKLITAFLQGLCFFALLYLIGTLVFLRFSPDTLSPAVPASCFGGAILGGFISALFRRKKH